MTDHYCVFGHPIAHSKSPRIHAAFAKATGESIDYQAMLVDKTRFAETVHDFMARGGRGANVTLPFKEEAFSLAHTLSERARYAGAVNTLSFEHGKIIGDNTDGIGLWRDITHNKEWSLDGQRILILGAGGAVAGVIAPLLAAKPSKITLYNRHEARALRLVEHFKSLGTIEAANFDALEGQSFDLVINGTSASLENTMPALPRGLFSKQSLAYEMMYGRGKTPFLAFAQDEGALHIADGLGMLVEQAAESFYLWRGVRPSTQALITTLASELPPL